MKTQSQGKNAPTPPPEALDEKITHLTEEVAKKANAYRVPALILVIVIIAFIAISSLMSSLRVDQEEAWSEDIYVLFNTEKPATEVRTGAAALADDLEGTRIEPVFAIEYAKWLWEQNEGDDRSRAVQYLEQSLARQDSAARKLLIELQHSELKNALEASQGFELPAIPEPPAEETSAVDGLPGGVTVTGTPGVTATVNPTEGTDAADEDGMVDPNTSDGTSEDGTPEAPASGDGGR